MPAFRHAENLAAFEEVAKNNHDKTKTLLEEKEALRQETEVYRRAKLLADGEREKAEVDLRRAQAALARACASRRKQELEAQKAEESAKAMLNDIQLKTKKQIEVVHVVFLLYAIALNPHPPSLSNMT